MYGQAAATLAHLSRGRFALGLGLSSEIIVGQWHGLPFAPSIQQMREAVQIIRMTAAGERVNFDGRFYRLKNFRLAIPAPATPPRIYLAALGPKMCELAGEVADGVLLNWISPEAMPASIGHVEAGAKRAGRTLADVDVAVYVRTCVTDDRVPAREALARDITGYAIVGVYARFFAECGFAEEVRAVDTAWKAGDRAGAVKGISPAGARRARRGGPGRLLPRAAGRLRADGSDARGAALRAARCLGARVHARAPSGRSPEPCYDPRRIFDPGGATMTTEPVGALSHFGLNVMDIASMERFYTRVLGLLVSDRGSLPGGATLVFLSRDPDEHHQLVLATGRPPGVEYNVVNQISFKLQTLADLKTQHARLRAEGIKEFRIVTHGNAWSIYFADPEGNRVELFVDTPWHTPQPYAEPFDIEAPVETILAQTEALCRNRPGFLSRAEWRAGQVTRMGAAG